MRVSPRFPGLWLAFIICTASAASAAVPPHVYATWRGIEMDKCASAWLIKRFVDPKATFRVVEKGKAVTVGIAFDTPDAAYRRERNETTFASIMRRHHLSEKALAPMAKIVWDLEVNTWGRKATKEGIGVNTVVMGMSRISKSDTECFSRCMAVFDALYAELKAREAS